MVLPACEQYWKMFNLLLGKYWNFTPMRLWELWTWLWVSCVVYSKRCCFLFVAMHSGLTWSSSDGALSTQWLHARYTSGSLSGSAFSIGSPPLSGVVFLVLHQLIYWSLHPDFGLLWPTISPLGLPRWHCYTTCLHGHQTAWGLLDCSSAWNSHPSKLCSLPRDLSSSFYKLLKTFIFAWALARSTSEYLPWSGAI